jgi:hypothetical protein
VIFRARRAIGLARLVVTHAYQFVATVDAFAVARSGGRFDWYKGHEVSPVEDSSGVGRERQENREKERKRKREKRKELHGGRGERRTRREEGKKGRRQTKRKEKRAQAGVPAARAQAESLCYYCSFIS